MNITHGCWCQDMSSIDGLPMRGRVGKKQRISIYSVLGQLRLQNQAHKERLQLR